MTKISDRYRRLATEFTRRVDAVPDGRWTSPSPCEDWIARDVLRHVVDQSRDLPAYAGLTITLEKSVDDDPRGAWVEARDTMQELLDDPDRAGLEYDGYFGRTSLEQTIDRFVGFDLLIHGWDLAKATGGDDTLAPNEVHQAFEAAAAFGDNLRYPGVCGPEVPVPADAPEQDRLLGLLGRDPRWSPA